MLSYKNEKDRTENTGYYLPKVEIRDYNAVIDGRYLFNRPVRNDFRTYDSIKKIATGQ